MMTVVGLMRRVETYQLLFGTRPELLVSGSGETPDRELFWLASLKPVLKTGRKYIYIEMDRQEEAVDPDQPSLRFYIRDPEGIAPEIGLGKGQ